MSIQPTNPNNPVVFFDITIGGQVRTTHTFNTNVGFTYDSQISYVMR